MKVFFSWSGERSKAVADALAPWLRQVIQGIEPWVSTEIRKGTRWGPEIAAQLELTKVGIICLTRDNLSEPWILFEAGALSKTKDALVATFLLDLTATDIEQPLAQFQHTAANEDDVRQLVHTLNALVIGFGERGLPEADLDEVFDLFWPKLKSKLQAVKPLSVAKMKEPVRTDSDILREILDLVRAYAPLPQTQFAAGIGGPPAVATVTHVYDVTLPKDVNPDKMQNVINRLAGRNSSWRFHVASGGVEMPKIIRVRTPGPAHKVIERIVDQASVAGASVKKVFPPKRSAP